MIDQDDYLTENYEDQDLIPPGDDIIEECYFCGEEGTDFTQVGYGTGTKTWCGQCELPKKMKIEDQADYFYDRNQEFHS